MREIWFKKNDLKSIKNIRTTKVRKTIDDFEFRSLKVENSDSF